MTADPSQISLHIPEGIHYECTGCGKCCGGWSVPMTEADNARISSVDWATKLDKYKGRSLFRPLKGQEKAGSPYTHAIMPGENGHCPFLVDDLCFIHSLNGAQFKPSICQLFPYCFNETPSGVYATVSFVSMGAIYNSGKALMEQREFLLSKLNEFQELFPDHHPNWSQLQLVVGEPLNWANYLSLEENLLEFLKDKSRSLDERFLDASRFLIEQAGKRKGSNRSIDTIVGNAADVKKLKKLDTALLLALHKVYFPSTVSRQGEGDFNVAAFVGQVLGTSMAPAKLRLASGSHSLEQLVAVAWPNRDSQIDDLLYRYFYSRIFAKLYFGAGFGQLSLVGGFHHLAILFALLKLQSRALAISRGAAIVSLVDVVAAVRQLEKRLGESRLGGYAAPLLELLLYSHGRVRRILDVTC